MTIRCPQCGTEAGTDASFCPQCGSRLTQPAAAPPPAPPAPPVATYNAPPAPPAYQPAPPPAPPMPGKSGGRVKWLAIGIGIIILLLGGPMLLGALSGDDEAAATPPQTSQNSTPPAPAKPEPAKPEPAKPEPAKPAQPTAPAVTGFTLSTAARGNLPVKDRTEYAAAYRNYFAHAAGSKAWFYLFDAKGMIQPLNTVNDPEAGKMLYLAVGDMLNTGTPVMVVVYEKKVYVTPPTGDSQIISSDTTDQVLMGDYDGDGKTETIFMGEGYFNVFRYVQGGDTKPIYRKEGIAKPHPTLFATRQTAGGKDLLFGHTWEGDKLSLLLYKWDGAGGAVPFGQYPVNESSTASWAVSSPSSLGALLAVSHKTTTGGSSMVEFYQIARDGQNARSLGTAKIFGSGAPALLISPFTSQSEQLLTIDDMGAWVLYTINAK